MTSQTQVLSLSLNQPQVLALLLQGFLPQWTTCGSISRLLVVNGGELTRLFTELLLASVSDLDSGRGWSWSPLAWRTNQKKKNTTSVSRSTCFHQVHLQVQENSVWTHHHSQNHL